MDNLLNKLGWKKVTVLMIIAAIAGIIYSILSLTNSEKKQAITATNNITNYETASKNATAVQSNAKTFVSPYYQISYPQSYTISLHDNGTGQLHSALLSDSDSNTKIEIIVYDPKSNTVDSVSQAFVVLGYAKVPINPKFSGVEYMGQINGTPVLHETVAVMQKNNGIIKLQLSYTGSLDSNIENTFQKILDSLQ